MWEWRCCIQWYEIVCKMKNRNDREDMSICDEDDVIDVRMIIKIK